MLRAPPIPWQARSFVYLASRLSGYARYVRTLSTAPSSGQSSVPSRNDVIFSGMQPTGVPHLGNYLGALSQWVRLQHDAPASTSLLFCIVDLHSLTSHQAAAARKKSKREVLAAFLAVGLDPSRCTIFYQSDVPAHSELHWILSCNAGMGALSRMTQWKAKLGVDDFSSLLHQQQDDLARPENNQESLRLGLFSYPVLQAADILLHKTTKVPVGEDQQQHVEFARTCAGHFNRTYADDKPILELPNLLISPFKRVMSLTEPEKKMSKSHLSSWSRIMLNDSPDDITKKIKKAVTDSYPGISYEPARRPGVSNLIDIISHLDARPQSDIVEEFRNSSNIRLLKELATTTVIKHLHPIRERYETYINQPSGHMLNEIAHQGASKANASADSTMKLVRDAVGI